MTELRLVLLGTIGCGKTSSGDTILGQQSLDDALDPRCCRLRQGSFEGRRLALVEAPRWYWSGPRMEAAVQGETERVLPLTTPGPHAFLLLVPVGQFTEVEGRVPLELQRVFGEGVLQHTVVLLTCGDYLMSRKEQDYISAEDPGLRDVIQTCGGRYHVINNRQRNNREQVRTLLEKVDHMVGHNGGCYVQTPRKSDMEAQEREQGRGVGSQRDGRLVEAQEKEQGRGVGSQTDSRLVEAQEKEQGRGVGSQRDGRLVEAQEKEQGRGVGSQRDGRLVEAQEKEQEREARTRSLYMETQRSRATTDQCDYSADLRRRRRWGFIEEDQGQRGGEEEEESVSMTYTANGLQSQPTQQSRSSSFKLTADGATLLQQVEAQPTKRAVATYHHRISTSPTSALQSPAFPTSSPRFSYSSSTPTITTLPTSSITSSPSYSFSPPSTAQSPAVTTSSSRSSSSSFITTSSSLSTTSSSTSLAQSPAFPMPSRSSSSFPASSSITSSTSSTYSSFPPSTSSSMHSSISSSPSPSSKLSSSSITPSQSFSSYSSPSSLPAELRLVLVGRSGAGKSTAGNLILGREAFPTAAATQLCNKQRAQVVGRRVAVVDTPDWLSGSGPPEESRAQLSSCVALAVPGPHAFLLCVPLHRPARAELAALAAVFGDEAVGARTLLLFTHADRVPEARSEAGGRAGVEAYIAAQRPDLLKLAERCGDRFHVMLGGEAGEGGVAELLEKVDQLVREAGGSCYSSPAFREAEEHVRRRQEELVRERGGARGARLAPSPSMNALAEEDEGEDREEAERSVSSTVTLETLPPVPPSTLGSVWASLGSLWGGVGAGAKMASQGSVRVATVAGSSMWEAAVSGATGGVKKVAGSSMWGAAISGATGGVKKVAGSSMWGAAVSGATGGVKRVAGSPVWGAAVSGATGGAKRVAGSPVWGAAVSGATGGAKRVAGSPVWGKVSTRCKELPLIVVAAALLGLVLGVFLWGFTGGAVGAAAGSVLSEAGRRKYHGKAARANDAGTLADASKLADASRLLKEE